MGGGRQVTGMIGILSIVDGKDDGRLPRWRSCEESKFGGQRKC